MRPLQTLIAPALMATLALSACASQPKPVAANANGVSTSVKWFGANSVETSLRADKSATTFAAAAQEAGVAGALSGPGPVTVFAPTNAALAKAVDPSLMKPENRDQLAQLVNCHVMSSELTPATLSSMIKQNGGSYPVITTGGCILTATQVHDVVTLTDQNGVSATLTHGRSHRGNGMIYKVDKVFSPKGDVASN